MQMVSLKFNVFAEIIVGGIIIKSPYGTSGSGSQLDSHVRRQHTIGARRSTQGKQPLAYH